MVDCPYAGCEWENKEGFFQVWNTPTKDHPWYGKTFCMDWDAQCTICLESSQFQVKDE